MCIVYVRYGTVRNGWGMYYSYVLIFRCYSYRSNRVPISYLLVTDAWFIANNWTMKISSANVSIDECDATQRVNDERRNMMPDAGFVASALKRSDEKFHGEEVAWRRHNLKVESASFGPRPTVASVPTTYPPTYSRIPSIYAPSELPLRVCDS